MLKGNEAPEFLGIDIAGSENTWIAGLVPTVDGRPALRISPHKASLSEIVAYSNTNDVVAACVDAQLSIAASDENGFRSSDVILRSLLSEDARNWVASFNSLMAVPIRARLLTEQLSPVVGTILETHPRACLHFVIANSAQAQALQLYKRAPDGPTHAATLWDLWVEVHGISGKRPEVVHDGAVDALVCATIAFLFHARPHHLRRLRHDAVDRSGRGPFYVLRDNWKFTATGPSGA